MSPENQTLVEEINQKLMMHGEQTIKAGSGWGAGTQGGMQIVALLVTLLLAIFGGIITGKFLTSAPH